MLRRLHFLKDSIQKCSNGSVVPTAPPIGWLEILLIQVSSLRCSRSIRFLEDSLNTSKLFSLKVPLAKSKLSQMLKILCISLRILLIQVSSLRCSRSIRFHKDSLNRSALFSLEVPLAKSKLSQMLRTNTFP